MLDLEEGVSTQLSFLQRYGNLSKNDKFGVFFCWVN